MRYEIDVCDAAGARTAVLAGLVSARLRESVNGMGILTLETVSPGDYLHLAPGGMFLRPVRIPGGEGPLFRVREVEVARHRERVSCLVSARHILADTADELFDDAVDCVNYTPDDLVALVLGASSFAKGTVEPSAPVPFVRFEYESVWDCLARICKLTGGELHLNGTGGIDLLVRTGENNGAVIRYAVNMPDAAKRVATGRIVNRVYAVGGGDPPMTLTGATLSGGNKYIEDADSIAAWGLREGVCHEPALEAVENRVATPALDGPYTAGLCTGWQAVGSPVLSKNTVGGHFIYGLASQRVQSVADGEGVSQDVAVTPGEVYSLRANVFVDAGTVRVKVVDGTAEYRRTNAVTGAGLATVRIEGWKALNGTVTVSVTQEGAVAADFSVDSVQIAAGERAKPFTIGTSADILYDRAAEYLAARKDPEITYDVTLVDRGALDESTAAIGDAGPGDTVTVIDETLGIDVATRIMEREADLLRPWDVRVRLDTPERGLADVLDALRAAQEEGVRHLRAVLADASDAAETGSSRLGFSGLAFRFSGTLTAASWNSVTWTAGTFRAGDCHYAVAAGSFSGLAQDCTFYAYFDRTAPAVFGITTDSTLAEGEDRILVFAVTTTVSPSLCTIHPFGVIHD